MNSRTRTLVAALLAVAGLAGCIHTKNMNDLLDDAGKTDAPKIVADRKMDRLEWEVGRMLRAYYPDDSTPINVVVDPIPNDTGGIKETPHDIAFYVGTALSGMQSSFRTVQRYGTLPSIETPAGSGLAYTHAPATQPAVAFGIIGYLLHGSELVTMSQNARVDVNANIGAGSADLEASADHKPAASVFSVGLRLVSPDNVSLGVRDSLSHVRVFKTEDGISLGAYYDGTGSGGESRVTKQQDKSLAISDATAMCVIQLIGRLYRIPYYRIDASLGTDLEVDSLYRQTLDRASRNDLLARTKRLLLVGGTAMDRTSPGLTPGDTAIVAAKMATRGLDINKADDLAVYVFDLWHTLDYRDAADRVDRLDNQNGRSTAESLDAQAAAQPTASPTAANFDLPAGVPVVIIDRRHLSGDTADKVVAVLNAAEHGVGRMAYLPEGFIGVQATESPARIHAILRDAFRGRVRLTWQDRAR